MILTILKRILKYTGFFILALITVIGIYMLSAVFLSGIEVKAEPETTHDVAIYLMTNGVHADIVVPVKTDQMDWSKRIHFAHTRAQDSLAILVSFGWGDRQFYMETPEWEDLKWSTAFNAVFGLGSAAMHTTFFRHMNEGLDCIKLHLNADQYARLIRYIEKSFVQNNDGSFIQIGPEMGYGPNDSFYEAEGNYNAFYTSNTWTNDALKSCGQKACVWTPFDKGIFHQYNKKKSRK